VDLQAHHIVALDAAERQMLHCDFCGYMDLKALLQDSSPAAQELFRKRFTPMFGLNVGGLSDAFKDRYFEVLFAGDVFTDGHPGHARLLRDLSRFKRRNGTAAMPFSFVSKLVAMRHEASPIYDRHVAEFFGQKPPGASVAKATRIAWFVAFLETVEADYRTWARDARVRPILARFTRRDPRLKQCDVVRLMDFLVWKVGSQKLLPRQ